MMTNKFYCYYFSVGATVNLWITKKETTTPAPKGKFKIAEKLLNELKCDEYENGLSSPEKNFEIKILMIEALFQKLWQKREKASL